MRAKEKFDKKLLVEGNDDQHKYYKKIFDY
jgi:hypothetical protein